MNRKKPNYLNEERCSNLKRALFDVANGKSQNKAAIEHGICRQTLRNKIKKNEQTYNKTGFKSILTPENTKYLKDYLLDRGDMGENKS